VNVRLSHFSFPHSPLPHCHTILTDKCSPSRNSPSSPRPSSLPTEDSGANVAQGLPAPPLGLGGRYRRKLLSPRRRPFPPPGLCSMIDLLLPVPKILQQGLAQMPPNFGYFSRSLPFSTYELYYELYWLHTITHARTRIVRPATYRFCIHCTV
jgi:hypothetical protein